MVGYRCYRLVIGCGDFLQLPPIPTHWNSGILSFESKLWPLLFPHYISLVTVHRQKERDLLDMINSVSLRMPTEADLKLIRSLWREILANEI